jgi:hypothetical protein
MRSIPAMLGAFCLLAALVATSAGGRAGERTDAHTKYASVLWEFVQDEKTGYSNWSQVPAETAPPVGPTPGAKDVVFANQRAQQADDDTDRGAVIVTEHRGEDGQPVAITVYAKQRTGYDSRHQDWYWVQFVGDGIIAKTSADRGGFDKPGFVTIVKDSRLWVFQESSPELRDFLSGGELAKRVILPAAGPQGMTLCGPDQDVLDRYRFAKTGFTAIMADGRLWVFRHDAPELEEFRKTGEPAKHVTQPGGGPAGLTIKGPDIETIQAYIAAQEGFHTLVEDGRIWVFVSDSPHWNEFQQAGELAKHVIRPGVGPQGMTVRAPDDETIDAYLKSLTN